MSRLFLLTGLLLSPLLGAPALAILISGNLTTNSTWGTNNNPYVIQGAVTVTNGIQLTLVPGVRVQFQSGASLNCRGILTAVGSQSNFITFTRNSASGHTGFIRFVGVGPTGSLTATGIFQNCRFTYMSNTLAAIMPSNTFFRMEDCSISNIPSTVLKPYDSDLTIVGNASTNTGEGVNAVRCRGVIASNHIYRIVGYADAIDLDFAWVGPGGDSITVLGNTMVSGTDPDADGIDLGTSLLSQVIDNTIIGFADKGVSVGEQSFAELYNNLVIDCGTGIGIKDGSAPILANFTIVDCAYGIRSYEKYFGRGGGRGSLSNSIIWNCDISIDLQDDSTLDMGYCTVAGATTWAGPGNNNTDPEFANEYAGNFRLLPGSPAINTAASQTWMSAYGDVDGNPRIMGPAPDRGAFEFIATQLVCNATASPRTGQAPLQSVLVANVDGPYTNGITYFWDTNLDGTNEWVGPYPTVTSTYSTVGYQSLRLMVSNSLGQTASATKTNYLTVAGPSDLYVSPGGSHLLPFTNWTTAATSIQAAVNAGFAGSTIHLASATYPLTSPVLVDRDVTLLAAGSVTVDGQAITRCFTLTSLDAVLDGLLIRNGAAASGAGVYVNGGGTIQNCVVSSNSASGTGGGIHFYQGGRVSNSIVMANVAAGNGGGIVLDQGGRVDATLVIGNRSATNGGGVVLINGGVVENSTLQANSATNSGGGLYADQSGSSISNRLIGNTAGEGGGAYLNSGGGIQLCDVISNTALVQAGGVMMMGDGLVQNSRIIANQTLADDGGGVFILNDGWAENCLIYNNFATDKGGGLYIVTNGMAINCTIVSNTANGGGGGMRLNAGGQVFNSIVYFNVSPSGSNYLNVGSPVISASCTEPLLAGNIASNPAFVDLSTFNLQLAATSPCIDSATSGWNVSVDFDRVLRPLDGDNDGTPMQDIGAYEYIHATADSDADQTPDSWEIQMGLNPTVADAGEDEDVDGTSNWEEYVADTDPDDGESTFRVTGISTTNGQPLIRWTGGQEAQQLLLRSTNLASSLAAWTVVTNLTPPTPTSNALNDAGAATNRLYFYRLKASRN